MTLLERFWTSVLVFHGVLLPVTVVLGRRWTREHGRRATVPWLLLLMRDAGVFAAVTTVAAALAALSVGFDFTLLRLLCQGLFGEGVALALWIAAAHARRGWWLRAALPGAVVAALVAIYWDAYHVEPQSLVVRHHEIDLGGAPGGHRVRILHLTDIQTARVGPHEEQALRAGLAEKPDLVVLTGDYVQERFDPPRARLAADLRALIGRVGLEAPLGVYAVQGDAEKDCGATLRGTGVTCLNDEAWPLALPDGSRMTLVGLTLDTSRGRSAARLRRIVDGAPSADVTIVFGHRPDFVRALVGDPRVDLVLAGHTHGGQVVLPLVGPPITRSGLPRLYAGGLHDYEGVPLHVSRGVGMERGAAPQIRFGCPPEICVLDVGYGHARSARRAATLRDGA